MPQNVYYTLIGKSKVSFNSYGEEEVTMKLFHRPSDKQAMK